MKERGAESDPGVGVVVVVAVAEVVMLSAGTSSKSSKLMVSFLEIIKVV